MDKLLAALHKNLQRVKHRGREGDVPIFLHEPLMLSDLERELEEIAYALNARLEIRLIADEGK